MNISTFLKIYIWIKLEYSTLFIFKYGILLAGEMNELGLRLPVFIIPCS